MKHSDRALHTRQAFAAALKKCVSAQPLSKVTVGMLLDETGFNRNTFYYHFRDIYDLLHWTLDQELFVMIERLNLLSNYDEAVHLVLDYISDNAAFFSHISDSLGREALRDFCYGDVLHVVTDIIDDTIQLEKVQVPAAYREFLIRFYSEAVAGVLLDWISTQGAGDRAEIIANLSLTLRTTITGAVRASAISHNGKEEETLCDC